MRYIMLSVMITALLSCSVYAQTERALENTADPQQSGLLILSKRARGPITRTSLSLILGSDPGCDQTRNQIPDGSRLISDSFTMNVNERGLGTFSGSVKIVSPRGEILDTGTVRGTVGINACEADPNVVCPAVCNRPDHLEGIYESDQTIAPTSNVKSAVANFKADLDHLILAPFPIYWARLDGAFTPPPVTTKPVVTEKN